MTNETSRGVLTEPVDTHAPPAATPTNRGIASGSTRVRRDRAAALALPAILVGLCLLFSLLRPDTFATLDNVRAIVLTQSVLAVLSIAVLLPLVIGEFDLSVGANLGLGAVMVPGLISKQGLGLVPAILCGVAICTLVGAINGFMVAKVKIAAFIATLGMATIISGVVLWYTDSTAIYSGLPPALTDIARKSVVGVPLPGIYLVVIATAVWYVLEHTPVGRYLYALGGSRDAARLAGLGVDRLVLSTFAATGFLCGIGGVLQAASLGVGNPNVGPPLLLPAFAAAFLGATAIKVGVFNVWGTLVAVFTLAVGITGLSLLGVPTFIEPLFNGIALIVAVTATRYLRRDVS
ncbi:ABC transporter permease [Nocardioides sp.]|uniref:ABC transporter permease n=1 Tax=Nocardioides sp. TaxID=35761 RepID=UPI003D0FBFA2